MTEYFVTTQMTTLPYKGLVRIRKRIDSSSFSSFDVHETKKDIVKVSTSTNSLHCLRDNVWYYCVARAPSAPLEWFPVNNNTEDSKEEDAGVTSTSSGIDPTMLLAITNVSNTVVVDQETIKLWDNAEVCTSLSLDFQERSQKLKSCLFYIEDRVSEIALLVETETQPERDEWVQVLNELLWPEEGKEDPKSDAQEAGENVVEDVESRLDMASRSTVCVRSLVHPSKLETLMEEGDRFGLLSLTTSALRSSNMVTGSIAPGMFAMNQFGLIEESEQKENVNDIDGSDGNVGTTEFDCIADTAGVSPSLLSTELQQSEQLTSSRERSCSNGTYSLSSRKAGESDTGKKSRRHSMGAMFGLSYRSANGCFCCSKRFGCFVHTGKTCASCLHQFCRDHCNQWTVLTTFESVILPSWEMIRPEAIARAVPESKRVCLDCFVRQQLLDSLQEAAVYYASVVDEAGGLSRLVRWKYFDQGPKLEIEAHIRARSLGPLTLLSAMFKYRHQPFMFVVVLAQLVHNVENCLDTMDFYWPQFLQWGFVNLLDASPSVRAFYLFFLTASARRSVHLAVRAIWECIAAHWDAMAEGMYKCGNEIVVMLFFVMNVNFGESQNVLPQLLFPQAPVHQRESFDKLLEQLYEYVRRVYAVSQRESPFFEWLLARSKEEVMISSRNVRQQLHACHGVLDPFPTDYYEETQLMILERRRSGTQHLVETKQRIWSKPIQHILSDEVRLVRSLIDLCTYLKENIPEPLQRKKKLPTLLQEVLRGRHIGPEAVLPLAGAIGRSHRVVNVLTNEGTVFSTKARAPTLVYFETIASSSGCNSKSCELDACANHDSYHKALVNAVVDTDNVMKSLPELHQEEITNYLDGNFVGAYMADLIPVSQSAPQTSSQSSISEDLDDLEYKLPAGCTPLSETASNDTRCTDNKSDDIADVEINGNDGMIENDSLHSTNSSKACRCPFFGERFADTQKRIREGSAFSHYDGWALVPVIAKSFDDMRQEVFVLQGLKLFQLIFRKHHLDLWMRYYNIVCTGKDCGLLEVITDAQSLDALKKKGIEIDGIGISLPKIFERACGRDPVTGEHDSVCLESARANFISSMAAYSLFCYIFLVKDRHNGNIMLSTEGHVIHIDFGFVLGIAPGNTFSLETAPFKLTLEMVEIMGVEGFDHYRQLVAKGLLALHQESSQLLSLVCLSSKDSCFPCFKGRSRSRIVQRLSQRLCVGGSVQDVERAAARIIDKSNRHRGTRQYDWFQKVSNGILP